MVILCMISQIIKHLLIKLRKHNMMQHQQSLVQSQGHLGKNSMLNFFFNLSDLGDGSENWLLFIKFSLQDYLSIYFNEFPLIIIPTFLGNLLVSHTITAELIHSRINFFEMS